MDKERSNLKEYYKKIVICKLCKRPYGSDCGEVENGMCPVCSLKLKNKKSRFLHIYIERQKKVHTI